MDSGSGEWRRVGGWRSGGRCGTLTVAVILAHLGFGTLRVSIVSHLNACWSERGVRRIYSSDGWMRYEVKSGRGDMRRRGV